MRWLRRQTTGSAATAPLGGPAAGGFLGLAKARRGLFGKAETRRPLGTFRTTRPIRPPETAPRWRQPIISGSRHRRTGGRQPSGRARARSAAVRAGVVCLVFAGIAFLPTWALRSGWVERQAEAVGHAALSLTAMVGLRTEEVLVTGRYRTSVPEILTALHATQGGPILAVEPHAARERLEDLSWVRAATVRRRLPGSVRVTLEERVPLARWHGPRGVALLDQHGEVVPRIDPGIYVDLPLLVGDEAPANAPALMTLLRARPDLLAQVAVAARVRDRRWDLRLHNGIEVRLPESGAAAAWAKLWTLDHDHDLLDRAVAVIDMRLPDRLILKSLNGPKNPKQENNPQAQLSADPSRYPVARN